MRFVVSNSGPASIMELIGASTLAIFLFLFAGLVFITLCKWINWALN